jgi:hypothetical protein
MSAEHLRIFTHQHCATMSSPPVNKRTAPDLTPFAFFLPYTVHFLHLVCPPQKRETHNLPLLYLCQSAGAAWDLLHTSSKGETEVLTLKNCYHIPCASCSSIATTHPPHARDAPPCPSHWWPFQHESVFERHTPFPLALVAIPRLLTVSTLKGHAPSTCLGAVSACVILSLKVVP